MIMIPFIKALMKTAFCKHTDYVFVRNIGGDEMSVHIVTGKGHTLAKSEWRCLDCNTYKYEPYRVQE